MLIALAVRNLNQFYIWGATVQTLILIWHIYLTRKHSHIYIDELQIFLTLGLWTARILTLHFILNIRDTCQCSCDHWSDPTDIVGMINTQIKHISTHDEWILQDNGYSDTIAVTNASHQSYGSWKAHLGRPWRQQKLFQKPITIQDPNETDWM